jgi:hypothetical protein
MASPMKVLHERDIVQQPLHYEKYRDLESEFTQENLVAFISSIGHKFKGELNANVS